MEKFIYTTATFEKALQTLEAGLLDPELNNNVLLRDGIIQRFEYTFELAWKMIQRVLRFLGHSEQEKLMSKKDIFRLAAQKGLLDSPEDWFIFLEARNETVHMYNPDVADHVFNVARTFPTQARELLTKLKQYESDS